MARYKSLEDQLNAILEEYEDHVEDVFEDQAKIAGDLAKTEVKNTSPRDQGDYAKGWRVKKGRKLEGVIVYNATHPGLTHLLEKGHRIVNQYGEQGRSPAHPHIKATEEKVGALLEKNIKNNL